MELFTRPQFYEDIAEEVEQLASRATPEVAEEWHGAVAQTIKDLLRQPHLGRERMYLNQPGIRSWRVNRFHRWLIFYSVGDEVTSL